MTIHNRHIMILLFGLFGCIEPFNPNIPNSGKSFLVVDGSITDEPGPYTVKISSSASLEEENTSVSGIRMSIEEKDGNTETLIETSPGVYQTISIRGQAGKSYRLLFSHQGQQFESSWETIHPSPAIDSIYFQSKTIGTSDKENDLDGVQFYIDNHGTEDGTRYFRYDWEETWRIGVFWPSVNDYLADDLVEPTKNPLYTCWKSSNLSGINLGTTVGLTQNFLSRHPLGFISGESERFTKKYSLLVRQYALEETEYLFWKNLQESNEELGDLFDKQPATVIGNISSVGDTGDDVLGYFSASGVQEERIYVSPNELPLTLTRRLSCLDLDTLLKSDFGNEYESMLLEKLDQGNFFYDFLYSTFGPGTIGALISSPSCSDCTRKGGDLNKPEFWDE